MRKERIVLENHTETPALRSQLINPLLIQPDTAVAQREQTGQTIERSRLAAPGRSKERNELARLDRQVQPGQRHRATEVSAYPAKAQFLKSLMLSSSNGLVSATLRGRFYRSNR